MHSLVHPRCRTCDAINAMCSVSHRSHRTKTSIQYTSHCAELLTDLWRNEINKTFCTTCIILFCDRNEFQVFNTSYAELRNQDFGSNRQQKQHKNDIYIQNYYIGVVIIVLDTPSHSAWSESSG